MSKTNLQQAIRAIRANRTATLSQQAEAFCNALCENTDALAGITASYRLKTTDTGFERAFALQNGIYSEMPSATAVSVTLLGKEKDLMGLLNGSVNPVTAILFGKIRIEGDKAALLRFSEFID